MSSNPQISINSSLRFATFTTIAATVAAVAAFGSAFLTLAPWAMFVGWVAYFTQPASARQGLYSGICLWLGIAVGAAASLGLGILAPGLGISPTSVVAPIADIVPPLLRGQ